MTDTAHTPSAAKKERYWHGRSAGPSRRKAWPPGEELAALRRGLGREPGSVPEMWTFYRDLTSDGRLSRELRAEHAALTLFALHQQSQTVRMHRVGVGLGTAMRELRRSGKFSEPAVDRRFAAAATATSMAELTLHLRGLITQLRAIGQPLDYDLLVADLVNWQHLERTGEVRRRWGGQYFVRTSDPDPTSTGAQS